jgi:serine-type D-Ala-D-Ala carboxypeptidase/endopeptidase (penicillin-binding protein 4)
LLSIATLTSLFKKLTDAIAMTLTRLALFALSLTFHLALVAQPKPNFRPYYTGKTRLAAEDKTKFYDLQKEINALVNDEENKNLFWGIRIESPDRYGLLFTQNEERNFIPASNQKVITSSAALALLDSSFRFTSKSFLRGEIIRWQDTALALNGDLVVRSNGNPCHSRQWQELNGGDFFEMIADSLYRLGVRVITGDLVGDNTAFQSSSLSYYATDGDGDYALDWSWDDLMNNNAAPASALAYNENCIRLFVEPSDTLGGKVSIITAPDVGFVKVENNALTGSADMSKTIGVAKRFGKNEAVVYGYLPKNVRQYRESVAIEKPTQFFLTALKLALNLRGITVRGTLRKKASSDFYITDSLQTLVQQRSPALPLILAQMNKESNNFFAEQVIRVLGLAMKGNGTLQSGLSVTSEFLTSLGISGKQFYLADGSGLSHKNRIAPAAMVKLLKSWYQRPNFEVFYKTLAIGGKDGTLERRLKDLPSECTVMAKTGYIGGARTISGYIHTEKRGWFIFSIMALNYLQPTKKIEEVQDGVLQLISNWAAGLPLKPETPAGQ